MNLGQLAFGTPKKKAMCGEMSHDESTAKCPSFQVLMQMPGMKLAISLAFPKIFRRVALLKP